MNRYAKTSELNIDIVNKRGKSIIGDLYFTPPFKVMKPFYKGDMLSILQMSASPGIMSGDYQKISINAGENTFSEIYSQSYEKIHKMEDGEAERKTDISVAKNSVLIYSPLPVIPYKDSAFKSRINVNLTDETSVFVYSDILTAGRVARGELFEYRYFDQLVKIYQTNRLTYRDNTMYSSDKDMCGIGMFEGNTHLLSMVICNLNTDNISDVFNDFDTPYGITKNYFGYTVVRALANNSQILEKISEEIKELIIKNFI